MTGGVSRGKVLERTCPYERRVPVSNARRDPPRECDDSAAICNISGHSCVLESGQRCPEFEDFLKGGD